MLAERRRPTDGSKADPLVEQSFAKTVHSNCASFDDTELNRFGLLVNFVTCHRWTVEMLLIYCKCYYIANGFDGLRGDRIKGRQRVEIDLVVCKWISLVYRRIKLKSGEVET